jgi:hypothetical protein
MNFLIYEKNFVYFLSVQLQADAIATHLFISFFVPFHRTSLRLCNSRICIYSTIMYVFQNLYIVYNYVCISVAHTYIMLFLVSKLRLGGKGVNRSSDCPFNFSPRQLFSHFPWVGVIVLFPPGLHSPPPPRGRGTRGEGAGVGGRGLGQCIKSLAWRLRID